MAPFPEYLSAVMSADASADAKCIINIGNFKKYKGKIQYLIKCDLSP